MSCLCSDLVIFYFVFSCVCDIRLRPLSPIHQRRVIRATGIAPHVNVDKTIIKLSKLSFLITIGDAKKKKPKIIDIVIHQIRYTIRASLHIFSARAKLYTKDRIVNSQISIVYQKLTFPLSDSDNIQIPAIVIITAVNRPIYLCINAFTGFTSFYHHYFSSFVR